MSNNPIQPPPVPAASQKLASGIRLKPCEDCGKQCSTRAAVCPSCGAPFQSLEGRMYPDKPLAEKSGTISQSLAGGVVAAAGLLVIIFFGIAYETAPGGVHNIGLVANKISGVIFGGVLMICGAMPSIIRLR